MRFDSFVPVIIFILTITSLSHAGPTDNCDLSNTQVSQVIQSIYSDARAKPKSNTERALNRCMRRTADLVALNLRKACESTVRAQSETGRMAFKRILSDRIRSCSEEAVRR